MDGRRVVVASRYCKCDFAEEFQKIQASKPVVGIAFISFLVVVSSLSSFEYNLRLNLQVWKYRRTDKIGISALEQLRVDVQTLEGQSETDVLLTGSINGSLR